MAGTKWDWCRYLNALRWGYRRVGGDYLDTWGGAGHPWRFRPRDLCTWYLWTKSGWVTRAQKDAQWWLEDRASCFHCGFEWFIIVVLECGPRMTKESMRYWYRMAWRKRNHKIAVSNVNNARGKNNRIFRSVLHNFNKIKSYYQNILLEMIFEFFCL